MPKFLRRSRSSLSFNEHTIGKSIVLSILISGRLLSSESDSPRGRNGLRCHQLTDCLKNDAKLLVVFLFQFIEASSQVGVSGEHRPEAHERPHDGNVHFDSPFAVENAREHRHTLLGEGERWRAAATAALCSCILQ